MREVLSCGGQAIVDGDEIGAAGPAEVDGPLNAVEAAVAGANGDGLVVDAALHVEVQRAGGPVHGDVIGSCTGIDRRFEATRREAGGRIMDAEGVAAEGRHES